MHNALWPLFTSFSWQELRHHPWRNGAAVVAVMLGVALAFAVHVINASALDEFARGMRSVAGQADVQVQGRSRPLIDEALYGRLMRHPDVQSASPVIEINTYALLAQNRDDGPMQGSSKLPIRVLGVDALQVAGITPEVLPIPDSDAGRLDVFAPDAVFLNSAARAALVIPGHSNVGPDVQADAGASARAAARASSAAAALPLTRSDLSDKATPTIHSDAMLPSAATGTVRLQQGMQWQNLRLAGRVAAGGAPLAVMDVAAAQTVFGMLGQLSRVDVQLRPGVDRAAFMAQLQAQPDWPADAVLAEPGQALARMDNVSRAYRVNLTVLALVALFTGGFLVYSVLALSVTRRAQALALLGVLGLDPRQRWALILLEAGSLGLLGSMLGIALGTGLAMLALRMLGGDLGGGYFSGAMPALQWSGGAALVFGGLGVLAALVGAWWPARMAARMAPAQTLKGLGLSAQGTGHASLGLGLLIAGALLALLPPIGGVPLAAYISVALILLGGISALPPLVGWLLDFIAPLVANKPLALLAVERARRMRAGAAIAVSGVVASLSLAVALTVMVGSFRGSMLQWLDTVLPAALYVRTSGSAGSSEHAFFDPALIQAIGQLPGVARLRTQRSIPLTLDGERPPVSLLVRPLQDMRNAGSAPTETDLALLAPALPAPTGFIAVYVSEAMVDLYGARAGAELAQLAPALAAQSRPGIEQPRFFVAGVWRDYARQFGTVLMDSRDFANLSDDLRVNDLALWLGPGLDSTTMEQAIRELANTMAYAREPAARPTNPSAAHGPAADPSALAGNDAASLLEFGSAQEIRSRTMDIFDRSFAVTYWLQAVAIGIGLFGVAANFSAQVLARRKEFGLLLHLGLTRAQVLQVLALEGAAWTTLGAIAGTVLGLAVAAVLVYVVNPQSFHWSMDMQVPLLRLLALAAAVIAAGTMTAWLAGRAAAGRDAVMAVKEDW